MTRPKITPTGANAVENVRGESLLLLSLILSKMAPGEQDALVSGLESFIDAVQKTERDIIGGCQRPECAELRREVGG